MVIRVGQARTEASQQPGRLLHLIALGFDTAARYRGMARHVEPIDAEHVRLRVARSSFGLIANPAGMQEMMTDSSVVIYVGPDPGKVAPIASYWLYWAHRYRETKIIVISPDRSSLAERSDRWLQAEPGTEGDLLKAMAKIAATPHASRSRVLRRVATGIGTPA